MTARAMVWVMALLVGLGGGASPALEVTLRAPLTTVVPGPPPLSGQPAALRAVVTVPTDAPADLGLGAYCCDAHGRWFQTCSAQAMTPGRHELLFDLAATAQLGVGTAARGLVGAGRRP